MAKIICSKGDDSVCKTDIYGDEGCCARILCTEAPSGELTLNQQAILTSYKLLGWPTEKGKETH